MRAVTSPPYYPEWEVRAGYSSWKYYRENIDGVIVFRCPVFVPRKQNAIKRIMHLLSFAYSSLPVVLAHRSWKPDVVIQVAPSLFCAPHALLLARLARSRALIHIQDYEIDAFFAVGMAKAGILQKLALAIERVLLRSFDSVSTISEGMMRRAVHKGVDANKLILFPNWSDIKHFSGASPSPSLLRELGVPQGKKVILYSGNIGLKQGMESLVEAAKRLAHQTELYFLIVGDGAGKQALASLVARYGLTNVSFAPLQPFDALPSLLASAECHLVLQKRGAADAVLPSKLTNILAVGGNAVITADADSTLGKLCIDYPGIAELVEPESVDALIAGIGKALGMPKPNRVARDYAKQSLDKGEILERFMNAIER